MRSGRASSRGKLLAFLALSGAGMALVITTVTALLEFGTLGDQDLVLLLAGGFGAGVVTALLQMLLGNQGRADAGSEVGRVRRAVRTGILPRSESVRDWGPEIAVAHRNGVSLLWFVPIFTALLFSANLLLALTQTRGAALWWASAVFWPVLGLGGFVGQKRQVSRIESLEQQLKDFLSAPDGENLEN